VQWLFTSQRIFISPFFPLITLVSNFTILTFMKFWVDEKKIKEQTRELLYAQDLTIFSLLSLVETRDNETGEHILRTQHYVRLLAEHLASHPRFQHFLDQATINILCKSAPLHDIGKVGVPDRILLNPGKFTLEEFEEMKKHTLCGCDAIIRAEKALGVEMNSAFLRFAKEITYTHHEKWDGSGYPQGLKGEAIPISGRLMALADVYDALTTKRVYKPAFDHAKAVALIHENRGKHFDPDIVDAFLALQDQFKEIAVQFTDLDQ